jgi:hypothetical protein
MLLLQVKLSIPKLVNLVRDLSKCIDDASIEVYKEMTRVIRFVLDTGDTCLRLKPNMDDQNWDLVVYSDSYRAGDIEDQISVTGFII